MRGIYITLAFFVLINIGISEEKVAIAMRPALPTTGTVPQDEYVVESDTIEFRNGDILTGKLSGITDNAVRFNSDMIQGTSTISMRDARRIHFPKQDDLVISEADQVIFSNGDRLSIAISALNDKELDGETVNSDKISLPRDNMSGIIFRKTPMVVLDEKFDDPEVENRFTTVSGEWVVEEGVFRQKTENVSSRVYAPVTQQGRFRYQWTVLDARRSNNVGFYFFASDGRSQQGGNSYFIMLSGGRSIYLYKCLSDNQQYVSTYNLPEQQDKVEFDVDYDSGKGTINVKVNGIEVIRWKDTSQPIHQGKYVILNTYGRTTFDEIVVSRMGDSNLPALSSEKSEEDIILFVNGDLLSGRIINVNDNNVIISSEYAPEGMTIPKARIASARFKGAVSESTSTLARDYRFILWNDDSITGKLQSLDSDSVIIKTESAGELTIPRRLLRRIDAPADLL